MVSQTSRLGLDTFSQGEDNWDHTDTVNQVDEVSSKQLLDSGTFTLSGGSTPAANETITSVSDTETEPPGRVIVSVDSSTSHSQDYAFNCGESDVVRTYNQGSGNWDVTITVNWDTDPGSGNDVTASYRIYEE